MPGLNRKIRPRKSHNWEFLICIGGTLTMVAAGLAANISQDDKPKQQVETCTNDNCHKAVLDHKVVHGPVAQLSCMECHEYAVPEQHLFKLTKPRSQLCDSCHDLKHESVIHTPVVQKDCMGCHDPHGSEHEMILVEDPANGLCYTCHKDNYAEKDYVHGPVAVEACVVCHKPHSSSNPNLLTMSPAKLCLDCHNELKPTKLQARNQHKPMEDGCTSCHDPHASDAKFQLHASTPNLCFTCHDGVKNLLEESKVIHGPTLMEGGCAGCHNPHYTQLPRLQRLPQPDLCLKCHNKEIKTNDGRVLANMKTMLEENDNHHGPIRDGGCTTCHQPHAADHFKLLFEDYPEEFYAPFEIERYALCFSCHQSDLVKDESGTGLTRFRNGDMNLHWLHVNRDKGRTCRACHEVHASSLPFHIRESVPFGNSGWMLELNFEKGDDGGSCLPGCHKARSYGRKNPVVKDKDYNKPIDVLKGG